MDTVIEVSHRCYYLNGVKHVRYPVLAKRYPRPMSKRTHQSKADIALWHRRSVEKRLREVEPWKQEQARLLRRKIDHKELVYARYMPWTVKMSRPPRYPELAKKLSDELKTRGYYKLFLVSRAKIWRESRRKWRLLTESAKSGSLVISVK